MIRVYTIEKATELYEAIRYSIGDSEVDIERMSPKKFLTTERSLFIEMYNSWVEMLNEIKGDKLMYDLVLKINGDLDDYLYYIHELIKQDDQQLQNKN
jgi:hypothetical protein